MESYMTTFLKTEVTIIPKLFTKLLSNQYNNALCNGAIWMLVLWTIVHDVFEHFLNRLLTKMRYKKYNRAGLIRSLWFLGFYCTAGIYCFAVLMIHKAEIFSTKQSVDSANDHFILGYVVLIAFFLHSAIWKTLRDNVPDMSYLFLCSLVFAYYYAKFVEGALRLTIFISLTEVVLEFTRCLMLLEKNTTNKNVMKTFFVVSNIVFIVNYLIIVPIIFGYFLFNGFLILFNLICWLIFATRLSIIWKTINHVFYHKKCSTDILQCCLFPTRDDFAYNLAEMRKEMKEREERKNCMRKPKNRNVVFQTLKCMVAIKKKLKRRKQSKEQEADVDENSEEESDETISQSDSVSSEEGLEIEKEKQE